MATLATKKYYVGDIGTEVRVDTWVDLTDATVTNLLILKPNATEVTWAGTADDETAEELARREGTVALTSVITYVTQAGDFNVRGLYLVQAWIVTPDGQWRGDVASFEVSPPWK
jgi:hypothetical protein